MLKQLKTAVKNKNINQMQQLLQSTPRESIDNFSDWFAKYTENLSFAVGEYKSFTIINYILATTFVGGGVFASWWHYTIPEKVSLITAIVCYCLGAIIFGNAIYSNKTFFNNIDKNNFIKRKKELINQFIEQRKHELNELQRHELLTTSPENSTSETSSSKTMNTATSSTD